ncbi:tyrosine-type recombinase/integrase [Paenibacillus sp. BR2-3]|uniref:tyrosine-type recombinase/integrase n=1 Tax=Paenibacillus sp. BR2-3 TaxID=3048494 RepID=UPI003977E1FA
MQPKRIVSIIAFELAASTGMRVSEILGLRWRDVDLDRRILSIRQALYQSRIRS